MTNKFYSLSKHYSNDNFFSKKFVEKPICVVTGQGGICSYLNVGLSENCRKIFLSKSFRLLGTETPHLKNI